MSGASTVRKPGYNTVVTRKRATPRSRSGTARLSAFFAEALVEAGCEDVLIEMALRDALPEELRELVRVDAFERGVLSVSCSHAMASQELALRKEALIRELNGRLRGRFTVRDMRVR